MFFPAHLLKLSRIVLLGILVASAPTLAAIGPVGVEDLPNGGTKTSSDNANGTSWGRAGGVNWSFVVNPSSTYGSLRWGVMPDAPPEASFDGDLTHSGEYMTWSAADSNLPGGRAVWTGSAMAQLAAGGSVLVTTRFTLTVTNANGPVPLSFVSGTVSPGIDVLASLSFTANLLFEARYNNAWIPLIQFYDQLATPPNAPPGQVRTGLGSGFYYEVTGMTLEQHDAKIISKLSEVRSDTQSLIGKVDKLATDESGRATSVQKTLDDVWGRISQLPTPFPQIPANIASKSDVDTARKDLADMLLILFGFAPCPPEAAQLCENAIFVQDLATQESLDALKEAVDALAAPVAVELIEVPDAPSPKHRRWIVKTTRNGAAVNAELAQILAIGTKGSAPANVQAVTHLATTVALGPGLLDLTLQQTAPNGEGMLYQFEFRHVGTDATVTGSALVNTGGASK